MLRECRLAAALAAALALGSCSLFEHGETPVLGSMSIAQSQQDLQAALSGFEKYYSATVEDAADRIAASGDAGARRDALRWKVQSIDDCRDALFQEDARVSMIDMWALCVQYRRYFAAPDVLVFGERVGDARAAMDTLESEIRRLAGRALKDPAFDAVAQDVEEFAEANPIGSGFSRPAYLVSTGQKPGFESLRALVELPLAPFRALQGVDSGAQAIASVAASADRMSTVASELPEHTRWQLELAFDTLENGPTLDTLRATSQTLASSAERLSSTAERLPASFDASLRNALREAEQAQEGFRATLESARATAEQTGAAADRLGDAADRTRQLAADVERLSGAVTEAGQAWTATFEACAALTRPHRGTPAQAPEETSTDWEAVAGHTRDAATELKESVEALHRLLAADDLKQRLDDVNAASREAAGTVGAAFEESARAAIDHAALRAAQLLGGLLLGLAVLRVLPRRR